MNKEHSVHFNWSGGYTQTWQFSLMKNMYEDLFAKLCNKAYDTLNPHLKTWNKEFDSLYSDKKSILMKFILYTITICRKR